MDTCYICGLEEHGEENPCCIFCYFTGRYFEDVLTSETRSEVLSKIRMLDRVIRAELWHQGESLFVIGVRMESGDFALLGTKVQVNERHAVIPAIPPVDEPWGVAFLKQGEEGNFTDSTVMEGEFSDQELPEALAQVAALNEVATD